MRRPDTFFIEDLMTLTSEKMTVTVPGEGEFHCYVAKPEKQTGPAVIVIQEIFGITDFLKTVLNDLAQSGYVAVAPDLFWRMKPGLVLNVDDEKEFQEALGYYQRFDEAQGVNDLKHVLDHVRIMPEVKGKVGCQGYCLGGKLAYLMSTRTSIDCAVGYYGVGIDQALGEANKIRKPLMLHIAEEDKFVPREAQEAIKYHLSENPNVTLHFYPEMDHGFGRSGAHAYSKAAADLANSRTAEFFRNYL